MSLTKLCSLAEAKHIVKEGILLEVFEGLRLYKGEFFHQ
jgi:hypothetical protein